MSSGVGEEDILEQIQQVTAHQLARGEAALGAALRVRADGRAEVRHGLRQSPFQSVHALAGGGGGSLRAGAAATRGKCKQTASAQRSCSLRSLLARCVVQGHASGAPASKTGRVERVASLRACPWLRQSRARWRTWRATRRRSARGARPL